MASIKLYDFRVYSVWAGIEVYFLVAVVIMSLLLTSFVVFWISELRLRKHTFVMGQFQMK